MVRLVYFRLLHDWRSTVILALSNQLFAPHHDQKRAYELARTGLEMLRGEDRPRHFCEGLVSMVYSHTRTFSQAECKAMLVEAIERSLVAERSEVPAPATDGVRT